MRDCVVLRRTGLVIQSQHLKHRASGFVHSVVCYKLKAEKETQILWAYSPGSLVSLISFRAMRDLVSMEVDSLPTNDGRGCLLASLYAHIHVPCTHTYTLRKIK